MTLFIHKFEIHNSIVKTILVMSVKSWSNIIPTGHHLKNDAHGKHIDKKVVFEI